MLLFMTINVNSNNLRRRDFVAGGPPPYNNALLAKLLPDACTAANQNPTSVTSFRRWLRTYLRAPDDLFVLAPQFRRAGRRLGADTTAETIIQEMIMVPARILTGSGQLKLDIGSDLPGRSAFLALHKSLEAPLHE